MFPNLYNLSAQQKELITNMEWFEGDTWRWVLIWRRVLSPDQSRDEALPHNMIKQHYPRRSMRDNVTWGDNGSFSVRSLYSKAATIKENGVNVDRLICAVWQKLAPPKVELMVWLALLGKLNTKERLARKGMIQAELNTCIFCNDHSEDVHHLLLMCQVSWNLWNSIATDLGQTLAPTSTSQNVL